MFINNVIFSALELLELAEDQKSRLLYLRCGEVNANLRNYLKVLLMSIIWFGAENIPYLYFL